MAQAIASRAGTAAEEALAALRRADDRPCLLFGEVTHPGSLYEVLQFVGQSRWRGELVVESGEARRSIYFDEGNVVAAASNVPEEALGEVLCRAEVLTREQVEQCAKTKGDGPLRFGEVAVVLGYLTEPQLFAEMGRQVVEIFSAAARTGTGSFTFFSGFDESLLSFRKKHPVDALLLDVVRRIEEADFFRSRIPSTDHVPVRIDTNAPASDAALYDAIDGKKSIAEIIGVSARAELEVTRSLFTLLQTGHVEIAPPRVSTRKIVDVYNAAIAFLLRELDAMGEGDAVRERLQSFAADGQYADVLRGAGPADDGTLDPDVVEANLAAIGDDRGTLLTSRLYDYASYALFLARPHLARRDAGLSHTDPTRVSQRVAKMLEPIAPSGAATVAPPGAGDAGKETSRVPRVDFFELPGVDPTRTVRMAKVTDVALARARASATVKIARAKAPAPSVDAGRSMPPAPKAFVLACALVTFASVVVAVAALVR